MARFVWSRVWSLVLNFPKFHLANHGSCPWLRLQCPVDMQLVEVFRFNGLYRPSFASPDWYFVGYSCIGQSGPISSVQIAIALLDEWLIKVPKLQIKYLPPSDAILRYPIRYQVLSDESFSFSRIVAGVKASLSASSYLSFECFDLKGLANCAKQSSGELKLLKTGLLSITAKSVWTANFSVNGVNGIEITGSKPFSTFVKVINVHPLFTHFKDPNQK